MPTAQSFVAAELTRLTFASVGQIAVVPMQDFLGLGKEAIMNRPSTATGNWAWRMKKDAATAEVAKGIKEMNELYGR